MSFLKKYIHTRTKNPDDTFGQEHKLSKSKDEVIALQEELITEYTAQLRSLTNSFQERTFTLNTHRSDQSPCIKRKLLIERAKLALKLKFAKKRIPPKEVIAFSKGDKKTDPNPSNIINLPTPIIFTSELTLEKRSLDRVPTACIFLFLLGGAGFLYLNPYSMTSSQDKVGTFEISQKQMIKKTTQILTSLPTPVSPQVTTSLKNKKKTKTPRFHGRTKS